MPEMTGIDLLKRTAESRPHMVRILLTGYTDVEAAGRSRECGLVYMYVPKPWKNDELKEKVAQALKHYETNRQHHALKVANERLLGAPRRDEAWLRFGPGRAVKARDQYEYELGFRVSNHAVSIAEKEDGNERGEPRI